jgi:hypothetical protein
MNEVCVCGDKLDEHDLTKPAAPCKKCPCYMYEDDPKGVTV